MKLWYSHIKNIVAEGGGTSREREGGEENAKNKMWSNSPDAPACAGKMEQANTEE